MRCFALVVAMSMLHSAPAAFADVFKWTDGSGTVHFTDDRANIPSKYRKKAQRLGGYDAEVESHHAAKAQAGRPATVNPGAVAGPEVNGFRNHREEAEEQRRAAEQGGPSELKTLASSLTQSAVSERDKAYAAFSWISANIYYDNSTKWQRRYGRAGADQSPAGVLASKRAVCEGMANLFAALANEMGLQSAVVVGRASGMRQEPHAWNAVLVEGQWGLVDVTRGSFLSPQQEFLARHFPDDPQWQLLDKPLTYQEWLKR